MLIRPRAETRDLSRFGDNFDASWFGISTTETAANNSAYIDAAVSFIATRGGGTLFFGEIGTYDILTAITVVNNGICFEGNDPYTTRLRLTSATADGIVFGSTTVQVNACFVRNLGFMTSATKTAGAYIRFRYDLNCGSDNCYFVGGFRQIEFNASYQNNTSRHRMIGAKASTGVSIYIEGNRDAIADEGSDIYLRYISMVGTAGSEPLAGLHVVDFTGLWLDTVNSSECNTGLRITPGTGDEVGHLFTTRCAWDNGSASGMYLVPAGGTIRRWTSTSDWAATNDDNGIVTGGTGVIEDLKFTNLTLRNNGENGASIAKGTLTTMSGVEFINPHIVGNSTSSSGAFQGITFSGTDKCAVIGGTVGTDASSGNTQGYNIVLDATPTNYRIIGVNLTSSVTGAISGHTLADDTKIVSGCIGYVAGSRRAIADAAALATSSDRMIAYSSISASRIVTLPAASTVPAGQRLVIVDESGSAAAGVTISVAPNGTDTIDGSNTTQVLINEPRGRCELECDGTGKWTLLACSVVYTNTLGADVALNNTANFFTGPTVAQGTVGKWRAIATTTVVDTAAAAYRSKLWDGTTVMAAGSALASAANQHIIVTLSGEISSPAGNITLSTRDLSTVNGLMVYNASVTGKDSTLTARRLPA